MGDPRRRHGGGRAREHRAGPHADAPGAARARRLRRSPAACSPIRAARLHVTAEGATGETGKTPDIRAFIGALSEYKVYLILQSAAMVSAAEGLAAAIHAGDLDQARDALCRRAPALQAHRAGRLPLLRPRQRHQSGGRISRRARGRSRPSPAITASPTRCSAAARPPICRRWPTGWSTDLKALKERLGGLKLHAAGPRDKRGAHRRAARRRADRRTARTTMPAPTSPTSPPISTASPSSSACCGRSCEAAAPEAMAAVDARLAAAQQALAALKQGDAWPAYDTVSASQRKALGRRLQGAGRRARRRQRRHRHRLRP